jgi:hypothetical protein
MRASGHSGLTTKHAWTGENPIVVLGVGRFSAPAQKIGDHPLIQRHRFFIFLCFDRTQVLLPNRFPDVQRQLLKIDVAPLDGQ